MCRGTIQRWLTDHWHLLPSLDISWHHWFNRNSRPGQTGGSASCMERNWRALEENHDSWCLSQKFIYERARGIQLSGSHPQIWHWGWWDWQQLCSSWSPESRRSPSKLLRTIRKAHTSCIKLLGNQPMSLSQLSFPGLRKNISIFLF